MVDATRVRSLNSNQILWWWKVILYSLRWKVLCDQNRVYKNSAILTLDMDGKMKQLQVYIFSASEFFTSFRKQIYYSKFHSALWIIRDADPVLSEYWHSVDVPTFAQRRINISCYTSATFYTHHLLTRFIVNDVFKQLIPEYLLWISPNVSMTNFTSVF